MAFTGFQSVPFGNTVGILRQLRELFSAPGATDDAVTVSVPITLEDDPGGTPVANTLYKANIAKGWIVFDGTGTIAISDSFNVASIDDNATGNYDVNWDTDFASANYSVTTAPLVRSDNRAGVFIGPIDASSITAGAANIHAKAAADANNAGVSEDQDYISVHAFGDQ